MLKTYLYITEKLDKKIKQTAKHQRKSKAQVMREALEKGITKAYEQENASAMALLKIAEIGKKHNLIGPKDSSTRIDELLWGKEWK